MTDAPEGHLIVPEDREATDRVERLDELGLGAGPDAEFDAFARDLAQATGAQFAMVNFIKEDHQYFAGLYVSDSAQRGSVLNSEASAADAPDRVMERDHGYCPHVVARRLPLVLDDVCDYPRFAGNPVVDEIGIRSYMGAPLIDRDGTTLGTICVVDREARPWGRPGLELIKERAAELMDMVHRREEDRPGTGE